MRIALLALHFAEYASRLALALSAEHEVLLVLHSRNAREELPSELSARLSRSVSIRFVDLPRLRSPRIFGALLSINRILREFSPDVLHVQEFHPAYAGWAILSFRGRLPVVLTVHDPVPHSGVFSTTSWKWKVVQWFRWKASRVIVHGPRMRAELERLTGGVEGRVDVIPHGALGRTGVEDDVSGDEPGTFLFFGRVESYKGLRYLLDAGDILRGQGLAFRIIVAGTGADLKRHRTRIASAAWAELIDRRISPAEVPALFRRATAVVLPYIDATQSGVAAMAFAFARPVVASRVGDVPEVVIDGRCGLIVPPRDAEALAGAMERLLLNRALRDRLASGAARTAREALSWSRIAEMTQDAYRRAILSVQARNFRGGFKPVSPK